MTQKDNAKEPLSKDFKLKLLRVVIAFSLGFLVFLISSLFYFNAQKAYLSKHLNTINSNYSALNSTAQINKFFDGTPVIFYKHDCTHCQETVPFIYLMNKYSFQKVKYFDLKNANNKVIASEMDSQKVPYKYEISYHNGKYSQKTLPLYSSNQVVIVSALTVFLSAVFGGLIAFVYSILEMLIKKNKA